MSGSSNGQAFIWHVDQPDQPPIVLDGHNKEVTAVCWSPRLTEVYTCACTYVISYVHACICTGVNMLKDVAKTCRASMQQGRG